MYEPKPEPSFTASPTEIASGMVRKPSVRARNPIPTTSPTGPERNSTRVSLLIQRSQVLKCRGSSRIARAVVGPRARHLALLSGTRARSSHTARLARGGLERAVGVGHGPTEKNRAPNKPAGRSFATSRTCPFRRRSDVRDAPFRCFVCLTFAATHAPDDSRNGKSSSRIALGQLAAPTTVHLPAFSLGCFIQLPSVACRPSSLLSSL